MESEKIKILFYNKDVAGVNYYRTLTPAMQLERDHSDSFEVTIDPNIEFENYDEAIKKLKSYNIIHYHRFIVPSTQGMIKIKRDLKDSGTLLVMDIDDYWLLDKHHPFYATAIQQKLHEGIIDNIKIADYITTTTDIFAAEIRKITKKDNVFVLPNSVNPEWMKQFQPNKIVDPNFTRVTYMAGSSHKNDLEQLKGVTNLLRSSEAKNKLKFILAGWDTEGSTTDINFNQEFAQVLSKRGMWDKKMIKQINNSRGDVDQIEGLPADLKDRFRGKVFSENKRAIHSTESIYLDYEKVFTEDYKLVQNDDYIEWLSKYERDKYYDADKVNFERRWTQKANVYASVLDETDISLAPLADNFFNRMKSNLKQVEVWTRKLPIICTDIPPYNVDGKHMKNCILVPYSKNSMINKRIDQDWAKAIQKLIQEPNLREDLGNQLYEDFKVKYNLKHVTETRAQVYKSIVSVAVSA